MNYKKSIVVSLIVLGMAFVPMVYAEDMNPSSESPEWSSQKHERTGKRIHEIYSQLNLTDKQKKELQENKSKNWEGKRAAFKQFKSYKEALNQELMKPGIDMNKINEIQAQLKTLSTQRMDSRLNAILEVHKILTPEQFAKFISLMEKHRHKKFSGEEKE